MHEAPRTGIKDERQTTELPAMRRDAVVTAPHLFNSSSQQIGDIAAVGCVLELEHPTTISRINLKIAASECRVDFHMRDHCSAEQ